MKQTFSDPSSRESRALRPVQEAGLLELVDGSVEVLPGLRILPAPGETPGHQVVRVESGRPAEVFYALGDLYHHPAEFARPTWMVSWASFDENVASRESILADAIESNALIMLSHIPSLGRVSGSVEAHSWRPEFEPLVAMRPIWFNAV